MREKDEPKRVEEDDDSGFHSPTFLSTHVFIIIDSHQRSSWSREARFSRPVSCDTRNQYKL